MKSEYVAPTLRAGAFHCPRCQAYAHQEWLNVFLGSYNIQELDASLCVKCSQYSLWLSGNLLIPESVTADMPHADMPPSVLVEFEEARQVYSKSPKAAAALLRLSLQLLCKELGEKGENINADIGELVKKGLPIRVQQALDFVRVVGNNAVHPGTINLNDTPEIALALFKMINLVIEEMITRPKEVESFYSSLPKGALDGIEKRDSA